MNTIINNEEKVQKATTEYYCKSDKEFLDKSNQYSEMLIKWKNNAEEDVIRDYELITDKDKKYIKVTFIVQHKY
jgi:hypothetical protein